MTDAEMYDLVDMKVCVKCVVKEHARAKTWVNNDAY